MKPVLLLGRARAAQRLAGGRPLEVHWSDNLEPPAGNRYSAVIVVDRGDTATVRRLLAALRMREAGRVGRVALLSYVGETPGVIRTPGLEFERQEQGVISVEYQVN